MGKMNLKKVFCVFLIITYSACGLLIYDDSKTAGWFAFGDWKDAFICAVFPFLFSIFATAFFSFRDDQMNRGDKE